MRQLLELTVQEWLEELAQRAPSPGGGSAAAMAGAMGAALIVMAARLSTEWHEAPGIAAQAAALRVRLAGLAQADADVYANTLRTLERRDEIPEERRDHELASALAKAAQTPLAIAVTAADVALLGAEAAERADPRLQADADTAVALAAAAAHAACRLVEVNLGTTRDDARVRQARTAAEAAASATRRPFPPE